MVRRTRRRTVYIPRGTVHGRSAANVIAVAAAAAAAAERLSLSLFVPFARGCGGHYIARDRPIARNIAVLGSRGGPAISARSSSTRCRRRRQGRPPDSAYALHAAVVTRNPIR